MQTLLKWIAPKSFNDGLLKCNALGMKLISKKGVEAFLDVGCGSGELTMAFASIIKPKNLYGIEYVYEYKIAAEKKGIICTKCDLNNVWPFENNSFDIILSSQNIEHIHNTRLYLEESRRCLKPDGQIIILTENLASWVNIGALFFGWQPFSTTNINGFSLGNPLIWHANEIKDEKFLMKYQNTGVSGTVGHVRVLAFRGLKDLMETIGFRNVKLCSRGYLPFWGRISDMLCRIDCRHGNFLIATGFK